jgi:tetratricopeptide (TPR) repeat protein
MGFFGNSAEQKIARGAKSAMKGQFDRAIADFDEAIRLSPSADAFYNRGNAYAELGQYDRAIADFDKAIRLNPKSMAAIEKRAAVIAMKSERGGEKTSAIADVDEATRLNPNFSSAIEMSGMAIQQKNELANGTEPHEPKPDLNEQANFVAQTKESDAFYDDDIDYDSGLTEDEFLAEKHKVPKNPQGAEFTESPNLITEDDEGNAQDELDDEGNAQDELIDLKRTPKEALRPELNALRKEPPPKDNGAIEVTPTTLITPEEEQLNSSDLIDLTKRAAKEDLGSELNAVRRAKFGGAEEDDACRTVFRPVDRELSEREQEVREAIYKQAETLEATYRLVQPGRYRSLALTSLEESVMWIVKELTR